MRCLVSQDEGELVAVGRWRGVVGLEFGGFAFEGGVEGRELRNGLLGQGEVIRVNRPGNIGGGQICSTFILPPSALLIAVK